MLAERILTIFSITAFFGVGSFGVSLDPSNTILVIAYQGIGTMMDCLIPILGGLIITRHSVSNPYGDKNPFDTPATE